jgi:predicted TIM-barrel fold metal-dependent hydrolase/lysophospholipase L1-like esterase
MKTNVRTCLLIALWALIGLPLLVGAQRAQLPLPSLQGTVKTADGKPVVGATVRATLIQTSVTRHNFGRSIHADKDGKFQIFGREDWPFVPSQYRVVVEHPGFKKETQTVEIEKDKIKLIDITLQSDPGWQPPDVVFLGDSITDRWDLEKSFPGLRVVNRGNGGSSTKQLILRFDEDVVDYHPKVVVISGGINDIDGPSTNEVIEYNLATLAEMAERNGIFPILAGLMPVNDVYDKDMARLHPHDRIIAINRWVEAYAKRKLFGYADYYSPTVDRQNLYFLLPDLSNDGIHPNGKGYEVMAHVALAEINKALHPLPKTGAAAPRVFPDLLLRDFEPRSMLRAETHRIDKPRFPVFDIHNHLDTGDAKKIIAAMDASNVRIAVNLSGGFGENLRQQIQKFAKFPGRVITFANINWKLIDEPDFSERAVKQLEEDVRAGARGLKVFKSLGLTIKDKSGKIVPIDDPRIDPIWEKAGQLGLPVLIHVGDPEAFFTPVDKFNERYEELQAHPDWSFYGNGYPTKDAILEQRNNIVRKHPRTTFIGAHMANRPEDLKYVGSLLDRFANLYVEFGARLAELGRQPYTARRFFIKYQDRIMFGSDWEPDVEEYQIHFRFLETEDEYFDYTPNGKPDQGRWKIYGIFLPDDVLRKIYNQNALKIFPNLAAAWNRS